MICYTGITGKLSTIAAVEAVNWRWIAGPTTVRGILRAPYALDNGAWPNHQKGLLFDEAAFLVLIERYGAKADFIVLPDIVAGGRRSLDLSLIWLSRLRGLTRLLIAVQDGFEAADVLQHIAPDVGLFLGGSTEYKLENGRLWGEIARAANCYYHIGRVNTMRRFLWASRCQADSVDGNSAVMFPSTIARLRRAQKQPSIFRQDRRA